MAALSLISRRHALIDRRDESLADQIVDTLKRHGENDGQNAAV